MTIAVDLGRKATKTNKQIWICVCVAQSMPKLVYPLHQIGGFSISICVVKSLVCHLELDLVCHLQLDFVWHLELDLVCHLELDLLCHLELDIMCHLE